MPRMIHEYTIPASLINGTEGMPTKVGLRPLTSREEIDASKVGGLDFMKSQYEAVKRSICELDGKKVTVGEADLERFWEACGPKMRAMLITTYNRMSSATTEEAAAFFDSEQVKVG